MQNLINSMKSILITDETSCALLIERLKDTRDYRRTLLSDKNLDLLETFPYFFVEPKLVCFYRNTLQTNHKNTTIFSF